MARGGIVVNQSGLAYQVHQPLYLFHAVGIGVNKDRAVFEALGGGDEQVIGEDLDPDYRLALESVLLREWAEGVARRLEEEQAVLGADPRAIAVENEGADLLAADLVEAEVGE